MSWRNEPAGTVPEWAVEHTYGDGERRYFSYDQDEEEARKEADVTIVAASKRAAIEVAAQIGLRVQASSSDFRVDDVSSTVRALEAAGMLDEPAVYAHAKSGGMEHPLVRIVEGRQPVRVGTLHRDGFGWAFVLGPGEA